MESPSTKRILFPFVTVGVMAAFILADLSLAENFPPTEANPSQLLRHWVYLLPSHVWSGGYWALLTAPFAHAIYVSIWAHFSHMLLDLMGVWFFGRRVEAVLGHSACFGLIFFSALVSTAMGILVGEPLLTQGATGIGCAMIGLMIATRRQIPAFAEVFERREHARFVVLWVILVLVASQLGTTMEGLTLKIIPASNASNLGGWLLGFFVGKAFYDLQPRVWAYIGLTALAAGTVVAPVWTPWLPDWHMWRATREAQAGNYIESMVIIEPLLAKNRDPGILNAAAWLLATARDERVRNGKRAEELALEACEATKWEQAAIIDTLAAAYAEQENWPKAIETQKKAVVLAEKNSKAENVDIYRSNLLKLERREKIRE